jgi:inorganic triphosphatase YgiF
MTGLTGTDELEIKLRVRREDVPRLLRHPALKAAKRGRATTRRLVSTYFDTDNFRLAQAGVGLRLRRDGRRWTQTVKGPADAKSGGGLAARPEYEWPLGLRAAMPSIDRARLVATPWRAKLHKAARKGLSPVFTTDYLRTTLPLVLDGGTRALFSIDVGTIRAKETARSEKICELEIELQAGDVGRLFELARSLAADVPLAFETRSKAQRGVALRSPVSPRPLRADDPALPNRPTAATALAAFVRASLRQIEANADGLLADDDPEWIHQMRIGTRRLRACLVLLRGLVPDATLTPVADEAKWLAGALGPARDLDVLATQTLPPVFAGVRGNAATQAAKALRVLAARMGKQRKLARASARAAVASQRFVRLVLAAAALAAGPHLGAPADSEAAATLAQGARKFARPLLDRRHRKLLRRGEGLPQASPEARHAARLAAKKLRYATEFFAGLFPKKRTRAYRSALMKLQEVLGTLNDAAVAAQRTSEIAGADSAAAATLRGYAAAQFTQFAPELNAAWRRFTGCATFWNDR